MLESHCTERPARLQPSVILRRIEANASVCCKDFRQPFFAISRRGQLPVNGPKTQPFSQPWATPRGTRRRGFRIGPTGQSFPDDVVENRWPVGPSSENPRTHVPQGGALGWVNEGPSAHSFYCHLPYFSGNLTSSPPSMVDSALTNSGGVESGNDLYELSHIATLTFPG